jgi:cyclopropane fatty-acyl-phospholipid synthase-like methyltransferase
VRKLRPMTSTTTSTTISVDAMNAAQAQAWDGREGDYWAANADSFEQSLARYDAALFAAAAIRPGDHVLDVGCGTGSTTRKAARQAVGGTATGIDLSVAMTAVARAAAVRASVGTVTPASCRAAAATQVYPFRCLSVSKREHARSLGSLAFRRGSPGLIDTGSGVEPG